MNSSDFVNLKSNRPLSQEVDTYPYISTGQCPRLCELELSDEKINDELSVLIEEIWAKALEYAAHVYCGDDHPIGKKVMLEEVKQCRDRIALRMGARR